MLRVSLGSWLLVGIVGWLVGLGWGVLRGVGAVMHGPPADDGTQPPRGGSGRAAG